MVLSIPRSCNSKKLDLRDRCLCVEGMSWSFFRQPCTASVTFPNDTPSSTHYQLNRNNSTETSKRILLPTMDSPKALATATAMRCFISGMARNLSLQCSVHNCFSFIFFLWKVSLHFSDYISRWSCSFCCPQTLKVFKRHTFHLLTLQPKRYFKSYLQLI